MSTGPILCPLWLVSGMKESDRDGLVLENLLDDSRPESWVFAGMTLG